MRPVGVDGSTMAEYMVWERVPSAEGVSSSGGLCLRLRCRCWSRWPFTVASD